MTSKEKIPYEDEFRQIIFILQDLVDQANAQAVYLIDKGGQLIARYGKDEGLDVTSLASLTASSIAAAEGLADLLGEKAFSLLFHEGERDNVHLSLIAEKLVLIVIGERESSLGLVRMRVRNAVADLTAIIEQLIEAVKQDKDDVDIPFAEITDEDIDNMFDL
ncbi:MAG: roadblock/LC7 domain-containing protein [Deltaproteobacteria bacterium]|nr:MAG: roadblock/LC7 domain-containing protein [Deltaproteobacteria bacterium]